MQGSGGRGKGVGETMCVGFPSKQITHSASATALTAATRPPPCWSDPGAATPCLPTAPTACPLPFGPPWEAPPEGPRSELRSSALPHPPSARSSAPRPPPPPEACEAATATPAAPVPSPRAPASTHSAAPPLSPFLSALRPAAACVRPCPASALSSSEHPASICVLPPAADSSEGAAA